MDSQAAFEPDRDALNPEPATPGEFAPRPIRTGESTGDPLSPVWGAPSNLPVKTSKTDPNTPRIAGPDRPVSNFPGPKSPVTGG